MYYVAVLFFHFFVFFHWLLWLKISICRPRIRSMIPKSVSASSQWLHWSIGQEKAGAQAPAVMITGGKSCQIQPDQLKRAASGRGCRRDSLTLFRVRLNPLPTRAFSSFCL